MKIFFKKVSSKISAFKMPGITLLIVLFVYSCIQPFSPPEINSTETYLVVDGFLNFGEDTTKITLSRTQNTNQNIQPVMEAGAKLYVEGESGEKYLLQEQSAGKYILPTPVINQSIKYRLSISTAGGKSYESEYVQVSKTPAIDSIGYKVDEAHDEVNFFVNTHDPQNNTHFYRWKFEETWEYTTQYYSSLEVVGTGANKEVVPRTENINTCYKTLNSGSILLGSTIKLNQDIIRELPINRVQIFSNKLRQKYSLLVRQYALSQEAFEYWTALSKTTQGTGSLFDALPSQVTGNIKNKNDSRELVFGYFSAVVEQKKRVFVTPGLGRLAYCPFDTLPVNCVPRAEKECAKETVGLLIYYADPAQKTVTVADASCVDCRLQGGTTKRPSFWK